MQSPYAPKRGEMYCTRCGESLMRAMLFALMQDLGARTSRDADMCMDGEKHDFEAEIIPAPRLVAFPGLYHNREA